MQNSPFQSCAHFLEISSHTFLWEQMAGHPRRALQIQTKQNSYQPGASWEPSWNQYHVNDRCCFLGGERPTWYTATWQGFFIFLMGTKCIQVLLTGTKDTEENWEGRKGKCQTHCWGSATESSWVWYWFQQNILQMIPLPTPRVTPSKVSIWQSKYHWLLWQSIYKNQTQD